MDALLLLPVALLAALAAALAAATVASRGQRWLLDAPGPHRSHAQPTPRGGGLGIALVLAALGLGVWAGALDGVSARAGAALFLAFLLVGAVGLWDDLKALARWPRLAAHVGAAALVAWVAREDATSASHVATVAGAALVVLGLAWSVNLHNFMDGIDGLLAMQALFVFCALAALLAGFGSAPLGLQLLAWAAACAGFLPFNFPRARIFMGDVGSGVLGLLVAVAVLWQVGTPGIAGASGLVLCSAFVTDATCTLLLRMLCGRRWYSAHREHLYQWLVRRGWSHARTVALYMTWNLLIVLPVVCWMNRSPEARASTGMGAAAVVYGVAIVLWWLGKRACIAQACARRPHAAA